jgi:Lysozyme like domain
MDPFIVLGIVGVAAFILIFKGQVLGESVSGTLSPSQISGYASDAGFDGDDLVTAVAVALAESSGNTQAYNPETKAGAPQGKGSYGLWQIYLNAHPEFEGTNLYDPSENANAAYSVYQGAGGSFSPWSTFKSGAYLAHVQTAQDAVNA